MRMLSEEASPLSLVFNSTSFLRTISSSLNSQTALRIPKSVSPCLTV